MKKINLKDIKDEQMVAVTCIPIYRNRKGKNFWIHYCKVEEDLLYYNIGWEIYKSEDTNFEVIDKGLCPIKDFARIANGCKQYIRKHF